MGRKVPKSRVAVAVVFVVAAMAVGVWYASTRTPGGSSQPSPRSPKAAAVDPAAQLSRYVQGRAYYRKGEYERALIEWAPLIDEGYDRAWTYVYAGEACLELLRYDDGLRIIQRGLEVTPPDSTHARAALIRTRGRLYRDAGQVEHALTDFEKAPELDPQYRVIVLYDAGILYEELGDTTRAIALYRRYLSQDTTGAATEDAERRLARLDRE